MKHLILIAALTLTTAPAFACEDEMHHHDNGKMSVAPSTMAFEKSMNAMHENMMIDYTGNPDADFVAGMIPHHQGAIDMAKIELKYGKDADTRRLAADIIKAQESEIKMMKQWQKTRPPQ